MTHMTRHHPTSARTSTIMRLRTLLPALLLVAAAACDSTLSTEPADRVPSERAVVDAGTAHAALAGAYDALQSLDYYGLTVPMLGDLSADNLEHVGTYQYLGSVDRNQLQADNTAVTDAWVAIYDAIARANLLIDRVPGLTDMDEEDRDQVLGEAYFLRALHYHNLVKLWGDVPMPLAPVASAEEAAQFTRTPKDQVYTQILADLTQAEALMTDDEQTRQASLGAVRALRARVLLYMGDWTGALAAADAVEEMGYTLAGDFGSLFTADGDDTPEDIFRVSFSPLEYNELGYYYLWDGRWETAPTASLDEAFEADDARHPLTVEEDDGDYQGTKFPTTIGGEDFHVLRLGEVVLIRAEALARLDRLGDAVTEYNKLRERAGLDPHVLDVDVTTQQDVLDAIWRERRVELALEGDRWPDLVRTGRAAAVLGIPAARAFQLLYPIPQSERVTAPGLTQNTGY
jgi:hypothetical protein